VRHWRWSLLARATSVGDDAFVGQLEVRTRRTPGGRPPDRERQPSRRVESQTPKGGLYALRRVILCDSPPAGLGGPIVSEIRASKTSGTKALVGVIAGVLGSPGAGWGYQLRVAGGYQGARWFALMYGVGFLTGLTRPRGALDHAQHRGRQRTPPWR
jgi:hypothetical protein